MLATYHPPNALLIWLTLGNLFDQQQKQGIYVCLLLYFLKLILSTLPLQLVGMDIPYHACEQYFNIIDYHTCYILVDKMHKQDVSYI